jgi:hypothetical protein
MKVSSSKATANNIVLRPGDQEIARIVVIRPDMTQAVFFLDLKEFKSSATLCVTSKRKNGKESKGKIKADYVPPVSMEEFMANMANPQA